MSDRLAYPHDPRVQAAFSAARGAYLAQIYNTYAPELGVPLVNKFESRPKAIERLVDLLTKTNGLVDLSRIEAQNPEVITQEENPMSTKPTAAEAPAEDKAPKSPKSAKEPKVAKAPKAPKVAKIKEPKPPKEPKEPKEPKAKAASRRMNFAPADKLNPPRDGSNRKMLADTLLKKSLTFAECQKLTGWDEPQLRGAFYLLHKVNGYGIFEDETGRYSASVPETAE